MAIIVPTKVVESNEGYGRTINQLIELFVNKELKERNRKDFKSAVIEFFDDERKPRIHLEDDKIRFQIEFKQPPTRRSGKGELMPIDLKNIKNIGVVEADLDPNSAKAFIVKWGRGKIDYWILDFDFRYNKGTAREKLERAKEFLSAASRLNPGKDFHVLIYLIWSALELILDVHLWLIPNQKPKKIHQDRKSKIKNTILNLPKEFVSAYQEFSARKNAARYAEKKIYNTKKFNKRQFKKIIQSLQEFLENDTYLKI